MNVSPSHPLKLAWLGPAKACPFNTSAPSELPGVEWLRDGSPPDGVVVAQWPNPAQLLTWGKPLLLWNEVACADGVVDLTRQFDAAGLPWMAARNWRFEPSVAAVHRQRERLGIPGLLRLHRWMPATASTEDKSLEALLPLLDLALWLMDARPDRILALRNEQTAGAGFQVHLGFVDGGMALVNLVEEPYLGQPYDALSLIGSHGAAYADDHDNVQLLFEDQSLLAVRPGPSSHADRAALLAFAASLRHGTPSPTVAEEVRLLHALGRSARQSLLTQSAVNCHDHDGSRP